MIVLEISAFFFGCLGLKRKFNQIIFYDVSIIYHSSLYSCDIFYCFRCLFVQIQVVE